jgi:signal transduction histidine kinase
MPRGPRHISIGELFNRSVIRLEKYNWLRGKRLIRFATSRRTYKPVVLTATSHRKEFLKRQRRRAMFKDLRTGTKIIILCATFIVAIGVTTFSLIAEKQIAIDFAKSELVGTQYLTAVRAIYADVLTGRPVGQIGTPSKPSNEDILKALAVAHQNAGARLQTSELAQALAEAIRLWSKNHNNGSAYSATLDVLTAARQLISRIADDSNLALDPDLDSYHLQDLITRKLPLFFRRLSEVQILSRKVADTGTPSSEQRVYFQVLQNELKSTEDAIKNELAAAYRGNIDGNLKQAIDPALSTMLSRTNAFLDRVHAQIVNDNSGKQAAGASNSLYRRVVKNSVSVWALTQSELDRLLHTRIDGLVQRMRWSVALTSALIAISIFVSALTHRHIVGPLERLENIATAIRKTRDYSLRMDYTDKSEIGQLATAFNDMLLELENAREREQLQQIELARVGRLTTMGTITASLAHEINQPLQAIAANSNAAQRWLLKEKPDLDETRSALKSIVIDAHRASEMIESVRRIVKKGGQERAEVLINDIVEEILTLVQGELRRHKIVLKTDLLENLPHVIADQTQLRLVFRNLVVNAVDAMKSASIQKRSLTIRSKLNGPGYVAVAVEDSGSGINPHDLDHIFDPFFTTKSEGMGLGLAICRSIIEAHGGRLWAEPESGQGTIFHLILPIGEA